MFIFIGFLVFGYVHDPSDGSWSLTVVDRANDRSEGEILPAVAITQSLFYLHLMPLYKSCNSIICLFFNYLFYYLLSFFFYLLLFSLFAYVLICLFLIIFINLFLFNAFIIYLSYLYLIYLYLVYFYLLILFSFSFINFT